MDKNKNENNNLIDVNYNTADSDGNNSNNSSSDNITPPPAPHTLLTEEQQKTLEEHLTPPSLPMMPNIDLNKNNNSFNLNNSTHHSGGGGDNNSDKGSNDDENKEKKKKKKKKDKKKNKNKSDDDGDNEENDVNKNLDNEDVERVIIKSPILLKTRKNKENHPHDPYSTEMSPIDSHLHHPQPSTPQIQVDPEMYFDGQFKKEKKKKKKKNGIKEKDVDKFLTPEERRIKENSKDAKSFFSNERTFLSWIGLTFSLGAIGTAILTWFGSEGVSLATGVFLWAIAMIFMAYSTLQFRRRGHAIRTKTQGPFDDQKGPLSLVAMVVIGVSIYLIFFVVIRPTVNIGGGGGNEEKSGSSTK